jgi:hypothetical protein
MGRLIGDDADAYAVVTGEADDQVRGEKLLDLKKLAVVNSMLMTSFISRRHFDWQE